MDFSFLTSVRFWKLFFIGLTAGLNVPFPNNPWIQGLSMAVGIWFGGSVLIGTIDKAMNQIGGGPDPLPEPTTKEITTEQIAQLEAILGQLK